jgi:hypothetical protein
MSDDKNTSLKSRLRDADSIERATIIDELPYEVGFAKPPKHGQFSTERQPARRRRAKAAKNVIASMEAELGKRVPVTEAGKVRHVTKEELIGIQLVNKAAAGDHKAIQRLFELIEKGRLSLKPSYDPEKARAEIAALFERLAAQYGPQKPDSEDT